MRSATWSMKCSWCSSGGLALFTGDDAVHKRMQNAALAMAAPDAAKQLAEHVLSLTSWYFVKEWIGRSRFFPQRYNSPVCLQGMFMDALPLNVLLALDCVLLILKMTRLVCPHQLVLSFDFSPFFLSSNRHSSHWRKFGKQAMASRQQVRATTETDGWKAPTLVFIVYELHCAHIPHINRVYCYWPGAVVEQENMRIFALSVLGIYSGGNHCSATLCKRLH